MPAVLEPGAHGLTFKELREEFIDRGFEDLEVDSAKVKRYANAAYYELCEEKPWPFLADGLAEETAPLLVEDVAHVLSLSQGDSRLAPADMRELAGYDPALSSTGSASRWYRSGSEVKVWPEDSTSTFTLRYLRLPAELEEDEDRLVVPARYQELVVDGMAIRGYKNRENFEAAQAVRVEWERGVRQMVRALLRPNHDGDRRILRTGGMGDYA